MNMQEETHGLGKEHNATQEKNRKEVTVEILFIDRRVIIFTI